MIKMEMDRRNYYICKEENILSLREEIIQAKRMLIRGTPQMLFFVILFYGILGAGIALKKNADTDNLINISKNSIIFGIESGIIFLIIGSVFMSAYLLRIIHKYDFSTGASIIMTRSVRFSGFIVILFALYDVFYIIIPSFVTIQDNFIKEWWMWLVLGAGIAGWFTGRSIGLIIGILSIWTSGLYLLKTIKNTGS